ncbi:nucleoside diphosphate kinase regulator [Kitasatospora xanthocidica]|uniref:Nucleoside diphosphate kinase regulator n=1 Tax=Kitasatospora xanthocidica TaxID=83382 RepID=A0A373A2F8_9ACTN|nr:MULTISPECIES: GreA/GreB family elongation factor [Kitasatospora]RGD62241.1 nucleoside diphosphate kinase regulator [Kitasatospora xanthocidica]
MSGGPEPISAEGLRAVREELAQLRVERGEVAATLRGVDPVGDRADAADELQRASEVARLDRRIVELEARLREAEVAGEPSARVVGVGSTVNVRFDDGTEETVEISEIAEERDLTLVTFDSPLGKALLGRHAGETVNYDTPAGAASAVVLSVGADAGPQTG